MSLIDVPMVLKAVLMSKLQDISNLDQLSLLA